MKWKVIKTPMWPNEWKVESIEWPGRNNSFTEYFPTFELAQKECDKRNANRN